MDWEALRSGCLACTRCELCKTRTNVVFGQGVENAEVLFVGEGPGQSEDEQGLPFVGRSGQLLDRYLFAIDLDRSRNCYIANIVKCRPSAAAKDCGLSRPHCRAADDPPGLFGDKGARAVHREGRHPVHGHLPPCCPAASAAEQAHCLRGFCRPAGDH